MVLRLLENPVALTLDPQWGTPKRITLYLRTEVFQITIETSPACPVCGLDPESSDRVAVMICPEYERPADMPSGSDFGYLIHAYAHIACIESLPETGEPDWVGW